MGGGPTITGQTDGAASYLCRVGGEWSGLALSYIVLRATLCARSESTEWTPTSTPMLEQVLSGI